MAEWYRELLRVMRMRHIQVLGAAVGAAALLAFTAGGTPTPTYASVQSGRVAGAGLFATYELSPTGYLPYVASGNAPTPNPDPTAPPVAGDEWSQHGHNAQRTSYTDQVVNTPWRWKWAWNGPDGTGGVSSGKSGLPRNVQPVTGGGRVYVAAGSRGVYALSEVSGAQQWNARPGGNINSTVAYDKDTQAVFVVSSNGTLYKLNASNGNAAGQFASGASSDLPLPAAIAGDRVFFSMGNRVFAINKNTMQQTWVYDAGSAVHTPPAYSPSRDRVFVGSADLNVHAINNTNGARAWRVRPVDPGVSAGQTGSNFAEFRNGWPVIADAAGFVLIKARLDWQTMWTWNPWPTSNAQMRSNLTSRPDQQALFVMDMDDGARPFIANIGHGGYGDGGFMPMGPQPVVKRLSNGKDAVYTVIRGHGSNDGRWDSAFGEMMLDDSTVSGYKAGEVRFIRYEHPQGATTEGYLLTDEQPFVSMAGDYLFGGHWMAGLALQITDRSASRGAYSNPIVSVNAPSIVTAQSPNAACGFNASHYCAGGLLQDGDPRTFTGGFYIYYGQGKVYDQYWGEYASWVVSNGTVYFRSNDGAIVAFSGGNPQAATGGSTADAALTPDQSGDITAAAQDVNVALTTIGYEDARAWAGKTASIEGRVQYVFNNGKQVLLGFENPHQGAFKILITKQQWAQFGGAPTNRYLVGDRLRVTGTIEWYQGDPVVYVADPAQIVNLDAGRSGRR